MNSNQKTVSMFLLATMLVTGTVVITTIPKTFAEPGLDIQIINCINSNLNINGIEVNKNPKALGADVTTQQLDGNNAQTSQRNGLFDGLNIDRNLVNICVNANLNGHEQEDANGQTCEQCFIENLNDEDLNKLLNNIMEATGGRITSIEQICFLISGVVASGIPIALQAISNDLFTAFINAGLTPEQFDVVLACLNTVYDGVIPPPQAEN